MKILALEIEVSGIRDEQFTIELLAAEAKRAWELYQEGTFRELYFSKDRYEAVLILECQDPEEAQRVIDSLPLVKAGLIAFRLIPLVPYDGFARLFSIEQS
jgi:muconolactone delta-isomerase